MPTHAGADWHLGATMFERFTERARRVVVLAQEESRLLGHNYIGTEHLLLGLLAERTGVAARALESLDITLDAAREQVKEIIGPGPQEARGHIPFTPRAKKILELSLREALKLGSEVISTEHLLLGLIDEGAGVGAQILERLGAPAPAVREAVLSLAEAEPEVAPARPEAGVRSFAREVRLPIEVVAEFRGRIASIDRRLAAIERHLGIAGGLDAPDAPDAPDAGEEPPSAAEQ
jgi:ATP-dependent Clp protease ATP-binding subunit ClpC